MNFKIDIIAELPEEDEIPEGKDLWKWTGYFNSSLSGIVREILKQWQHKPLDEMPEYYVLLLEEVSTILAAQTIHRTPETREERDYFRQFIFLTKIGRYHVREEMD